MKSKLFYNIEYILSIHNYAVIPGLGAFVLNTKESQLWGGGISLPSFEISFNPELTHDDGLLILNISSKENLPYNTASGMLKAAVKSIKEDIKYKGEFRCGNLGSLYLDTNKDKILFKSNKTYTHPSFYGLTNLTLSKLDELNKREHREHKVHSFRHIAWTGVAAGIAAILFFTPSSTIGDNTNNVQSAGFQQTLAMMDAIESKSTYKISPTLEKIKAGENEDANQFYIIIAGDNIKNRATNILHRIRQTDFPEANMLESKNRYRIYSAAYTNKEDAEQELTILRENNSKYKNAWLYTEE